MIVAAILSGCHLDSYGGGVVNTFIFLGFAITYLNCYRQNLTPCTFFLHPPGLWCSHWNLLFFDAVISGCSPSGSSSFPVRFGGSCMQDILVHMLSCVELFTTIHMWCDGPWPHSSKLLINARHSCQIWIWRKLHARHSQDILRLIV